MTNLKVLNTGQSTVGWHRHGTMLLCPQKYSYSYVLGLKRGEGKSAPFLGTLVHLGLAHYYLHLGISQRGRHDHAKYAGYREAISVHGTTSDEGRQFKPPEQAELVIKATDIVEKYIKTYGERDSKGLEILKVEHELRTEIDGELYTQRADLIVRSKRDSKVYIWDHKTAGGFGLSYGAAQYTLSGQILGLRYLGQKIYGSQYGDVLLNMIGTKKAGDFERVYASAAPSSQERWLDTLRYARQRIKALAPRDPLNYPRTLDPTVCYSYGGCDFYDQCRWGV